MGGTAYRIALGDNDSTGYSGEDEAGIVINTDVDSASESLDTFAHASYRGAKYYISAKNNLGETIGCRGGRVVAGFDTETGGSIIS